ncbi:hypothetical protein [Streptomyces sp. CoH17]|uniref:hypothetical protein n=1 Tax=Streptomyces sp. CoH17 TaxID=2992806 RepID=UPI0022722583|nr:hypothetical protein [Streptomyces sp. CoH17]
MKFIAYLHHPDTSDPIPLEVEANHYVEAKSKAEEVFEEKYSAVTFDMEITVKETS